MYEGFPGGLNLSAVNWKKNDDPNLPGDETVFSPQGFLLDEPTVAFPWRDSAPDRYYGAQEPSANPILNAPLQEPSGGTIYFETTDAGRIESALAAMGVRLDSKDYAAFAASSPNPVESRYVDQIKFVWHGALRSLFKVDDDKIPPDQTLTLRQALTQFVKEQDAKWNEPGRPFSTRLRGAAGGDGEWAKEALAFGFHVENSFWQIYRIWSRAWLVTK
ncbi:hypothetical protein [Hoeflea poritis]|uniref:Uncharacterized protein n=1 Tax=Hoeflea poritis TaxID=2993659 RepID=A0ABT4VRJ7_9HYPH|nr:hypothetical protein [Hoeflea poritis]MDA4847286.1 hypothetical protein [Hoeflea poritis]